MVRLWRRYLLVGGVAVLCYPFVPAGVSQDVAYLAVGLSCVASIVAGLLHRPVRRAPWYLMALGQLLWVVGDVVNSWQLDIAHNSTFPSAADAFYLSAYPVLAAGLLLMIKGRLPRRDLMQALRGRGVLVAVDHFGTGGSWTRRLHTLPIDIIKTDRLFLDHADPDSKKLLGLLVRAAHTFGRAVIADEVEHQSQVDALRGLDCEYAKGSQFGQPMDATDVLAQLARNESVGPPMGMTWRTGPD